MPTSTARDRPQSASWRVVCRSSVDRLRLEHRRLLRSLLRHLPRRRSTQRKGGRWAVALRPLRIRGSKTKRPLATSTWTRSITSKRQV